jgi:hypothetical protein
MLLFSSPRGSKGAAPLTRGAALQKPRQILFSVVSALSQPRSVVCSSTHSPAIRRSDAAAVRVLKVLLAAKDDFYDRHVEKHNLLEPVAQLLLANGPRYNLLNSAILELFDFIKKA